MAGPTRIYLIFEAQFELGTYLLTYIGIGDLPTIYYKILIQQAQWKERKELILGWKIHLLTLSLAPL